MGPAAAPATGRSGPGTLDLYLVRALIGPFALVLAGVFAAMMLERALRLVQELAASGADLSFFAALLAQLAPYYVNLALPAAFFAALALAIARLDDRLEIEAMLAAGRSFGRIAAPLAAAGIMVAALSLVAGGWLEPHGRHAFRATKAAAINAGRLSRLQPQAIHRQPDLVLTVDRRRPGAGIAGLFVWRRLADGRELVLTAQDGRIGFGEERRELVVALDRGRYVEGPETPRPRHFAFASMQMRQPLELGETEWRRGWDQKEMTLPELARGMRSGAPGIARHELAAELYARLARALTIPLLPFLVLPVAVAVKKERRGAGLLLAGILLVAFHHALNSTRSLGVAGSIDPLLGTLAAAGLFAAAILLLFRSGRRLPSHSPVADALRPLVRSLAAIGPRRGGTARQRATGPYLRSTLARHVGLALVAAVAILQLVDFVERGDEFLARGLGVADAAYHGWLRLPAMLQQAIPIAALAGAISAFASLDRSWEMVAMRAAGISQFRVFRMALPVFAALSAATLLLAEQAVPASQARFQNWWASTRPQPQAEPRWFRIGGDIVRAAGASTDGTRIDRLSIYRRDPNGLLAELIGAERATAAEGWRLENGTRTRFGESATSIRRFDADRWPTALRPQDVRRFFAGTPSLSSAAARRTLASAAPAALGDSVFATRIARSLAEPITPIVMLLLSLPVAFAGAARKPAWHAIVYAAGGALLYLVADGLLSVSAQAGLLPPLVGALAAPLLGLLIGWTVLVYTEC